MGTAREAGSMRKRPKRAIIRSPKARPAAVVRPDPSPGKTRLLRITESFSDRGAFIRMYVHQGEAGALAILFDSHDVLIILGAHL